MEMDKKVNAHFHLYATSQRAQRINLAYEILKQYSSNITEKPAVLPLNLIFPGFC